MSDKWCFRCPQVADRAELLLRAEQLLLDAGDEPTADQVVAAARALMASDAA